ncbi:sodium-independent sulfate anion transporter-like isoform X1 [Harmonia axyridis]|uniref:sodium-independent sulfate anion transporter-like isoform X1 n=2 Tax=Harmonia axyridis TaxID=115357 RepID=UPI001E277D74|nr:sodium-independent sulfate anion transporter-like isoform X1 [Harmonia axyridis]
MTESSVSSTQNLHKKDGELPRIPTTGRWLDKIRPMDLVKTRIPLLQWAPKYKLSYFLKDCLAGFTVALTEIPQGIAYAKVAGLDPVYGLYSGFMGCFIYFIFGSCKDLNIGPTSILSLMIQSHVYNLGPDMAVLSTFTTGCIIFLLGLFNLGFVVEFFSYPVIAGFTSAGALQIASSQLNSLFGIDKKSSEFVEAWKVVFQNLDSIRWTDTTLGLLSIVALMVLREFKRLGSLKYRPELSTGRNIFSITSFMLFLSRNALIVIIGTVLAYLLEESDGQYPFRITGNITEGVPSFKLPPFSTVYHGHNYSFSDMTKELGSTIIFAPLVAILETVAIAKAFAGGKTLDATQEMFAVGACNIMGSFVSSMPVTGSFTRTAVNNASGVITTFGGVITGLLVLLALTFITSTFYYIPKATLASVVICAMFYLFDFEAFVVLWRTKKSDLIPLLVTFLVGVFWSLENGILIGISCNLLFVLYSSARPKFFIEQLTCGGRCVYLVSPKTYVQFPAAEYLRKIIAESCTVEGIVVVINGKNIGNIDATVARSFSILREEVEKRNQRLLFIDLKPVIRQTLLNMDASLVQIIVDTSLEDAIRKINESSDFSSLSSVT